MSDVIAPHSDSFSGLNPVGDCLRLRRRGTETDLRRAALVFTMFPAVTAALI